MKKLAYCLLFICLNACGDYGDKDPSKSGKKASTPDDISKSDNSAPTTSDAPVIIRNSVIKTYPHDTSSFTEGLIFYNGGLYESTGEYGKSRLLKLDLSTGKVLRQAALDKKYFGEGITILRDTVYQLTWRENTVFVYKLKDFKKVREFKIDTEGWGMTTNGNDLIVGDGGSNLYYYNPSTFQLLRTQSIMQGDNLAYNLNELEFIDGYIYANQWQTPYIVKIDPGSGTVVGRIDISDIANQIKGKDPLADVPNGIAYDSESKKIYITGKNWPELYEIQLGH